MIYRRLTRRVEFLKWSPPWIPAYVPPGRPSLKVNLRGQHKRSVTLDLGSTLLTLSWFVRTPRRQRKNRAILLANMKRNG